MKYNPQDRIEKAHLKLDSQFYELAPRDYLRFMDEVKLAATPSQQKLLAPQSCHGHAMNGDKAFAISEDGETVHHLYPNSTISDVVDAIIRVTPSYYGSVDEFQRARLALVKELKGWVDETIKGRYKSYSPRRLVDKKGQPLMGIEMFRHTSIGNPRSVLAGIFLGAYMDSPEWREQTEDYFGRVHGLELNMHKGLCTAGNLDALKANGLTLSGLSSLCSDSMNRHSLASLMESGCVVDFSRKSRKVRTAGVANKYPYVPVYVELSRGPGISDDAAFNYASIMYGLEAGFGLILIDAVDTIDKCVPRIKRKGEDELLGDFIREKVKKEGGIESFLGVTDQDILNLIYACAIDREKPGCWPSCSQRRFLEYAPNGNYALLNHIDHVRHVCNGDAAPGEIKLSINEIPSRRFYTAFRDRIQLMLQKGIISKDEARHPEHLEYFEKNGH